MSVNVKKRAARQRARLVRNRVRPRKASAIGREMCAARAPVVLPVGPTIDQQNEALARQDALAESPYLRTLHPTKGLRCVSLKRSHVQMIMAEQRAGMFPRSTSAVAERLGRGY